jgi:predicted DNA binding protein
MKTQVIAVLLGGLLYAPLASAAVPADRISVFKAPLVCPAARQIGCGSASKPILLDLEQQTGVAEAWLNRAGTIIAVVWKPDATAEARSHVAGELKEDRATEIEGASRDEAVKDFLSGKSWYRGADVDRLSEEEADVIAARLVRRVQAKTALAKDKAEGLQHALADVYKQRLTNKISREQELSRFLDIGREYLAKDQVAILNEAIEGGVLPLPNEG